MSMFGFRFNSFCIFASSIAIVRNFLKGFESLYELSALDVLQCDTRLYTSSCWKTCWFNVEFQIIADWYVIFRCYIDMFYPHVILTSYIYILYPHVITLCYIHISYCDPKRTDFLKKIFNFNPQNVKPQGQRCTNQLKISGWYQVYNYWKIKDMVLIHLYYIILIYFQFYNTDVIIS